MTKELNAIDLKIIELFKSGMTTAKIGDEVGKTKNSICGLIYRYRSWGYISDKRTGGAGMPKPQKERTRNPHVVKKRLNYLFSKPRLDMSIAKRAIPEVPLSAPVTNGVTFWKLKKNSCRYVLNDGRPETFKFCGEPIHSKSYCAYHASICYVPNVKKRSEELKRNA